MKKRTLNKKSKVGRSSRADPKRESFQVLERRLLNVVRIVYHGARGRYHYFLCLQLIFRKQIAALIQLWDLPPEFEVWVYI
jgi:RNA polymerase I-specific transcription initiation factor RRN7